VQLAKFIARKKQEQSGRKQGADSMTGFFSVVKHAEKKEEKFMKPLSIQ